MALLSFRGINTPSLPAQGGQRRFSYFNIQRGNPELGSAHDFGWHLQNRGRRDGQWVDLAMIAAWAGLIAWVLVHH
jgi:hypothetical protein